MIRCEDQGVVFFHNPKAAGTSISMWFRKNFPLSRHIEPQHILPSDIEYTGWSFCVVRNPWDRWVSWWYHWRHKTKRIDTSFEEYTFDYFSGKYPMHTGVGHYSFLNLQNDMAKDLDYIIRFENLIEDFSVVQSKVGCFDPLGRSNTGLGRKNYQSYYTNNDLIDIVSKFYAKDIEKFGYKYEV
jgi:hypothetical protein